LVSDESPKRCGRQGFEKSVELLGQELDEKCGSQVPVFAQQIKEEPPKTEATKYCRTSYNYI
jgi:hypothetical protein